MVQFICAKSTQFYDAFATLLDERSDLIWDKLIEIVGGRDKPFWFAQVVLLALEISADYKRRVIMKVQTFPLLLVWLVWSRPLKDCGCRRSCAADLLSPGLSEFCRDDTTHKIIFLFKKELEEARDHGTLDVDLHELLMDLCWLWKLDTQAIEGVNGILKHNTSICPYVAWQLMSSRITNRKVLTSEGISNPDAVRELASECVFFYKDAQQVDKDETRFDAVDATSYLPAPESASHRDTTHTKKTCIAAVLRRLSLS